MREIIIISVKNNVNFLNSEILSDILENDRKDKPKIFSLLMLDTSKK
jgi:hypothetical protein